MPETNLSALSPEPAPAQDQNEASLLVRIRYGQKVDIAVSAGPEDVRLKDSPTAGRRQHLRLAEAVLAGAQNPAFLSGVTALLCAFVLLTGLTRFPYSFLPEEALSSVYAADLVRSGLRDSSGVFLPAFFPLPGGGYGLGSQVYLQLLPQLFGLSGLEWVRGLSAVLSFASLLALSWALRRVYRLAHAWTLLPLAFSAPLVFHFARSGSPAALAAAFGTGGLAAYAFYRSGCNRCLLAAAALGWLAFYSTPAMRITAILSFAYLVISDWRYHLSVKRAWAGALLVSLPFAACLGRALAAGGMNLVFPIQSGPSAWLDNAWQVINPFFWMGGRLPPYYQLGGAPLGWLSWLLAAWGLVVLLRQTRKWPYRLALIGLTAAAGGPILSEATPGSLLPVALGLALLAVFGLHELAARIARRWPGLPGWAVPLGLLLALGGSLVWGSIRTLQGAGLAQADFGRDGLQYGAPQVFAAAERYARQNPGQTVLVEGQWSQDIDLLMRFFLPRNSNIRPGNLDRFLHRVDASLEEHAFVLRAQSYDEIMSSGKFVPNVHETISLPDGRPAFYLLELAYAPEIERILREEAARRRTLLESSVEIEGRQQLVRHSAFDIGSPDSLFDGDLSSLARSAEANPLVIEIYFYPARRLEGVRVRVGAEELALRAAVVTAESGQVKQFETRAGRVDGYKDMEILFGAPLEASRLRIELLDEQAGEPAHVHLWEITLLPAAE